MQKIHSVLGENKIYNTKTIHFQFLVRIFGVIVAVLLIRFSEYPLNMPVFYSTAVIFSIYSIFVRNAVKLHSNMFFQSLNLYVDVLVLTFLISFRGGLRSDFFLGYYLILGYVLLLRDKNLLLRISLWIVLNFVVVSFLFTPVGDFSLGRLIIRLVLIIGTMYLLSNYSSMLLEEESLKIRAAQLAIKDGLTNLYNRHILSNMDDLLVNESGSYFFVILDIDDFKAINDTYGHRYGDEVLVLLSKLIESTISNDDLSIRYGGEEFLLIIHSEKYKMVEEKVNQILLGFKKNNFKWYEFGHPITFSAGVSEKQSGETVEECIERADKNLYKAKNEGKNRIEY